MERREFLSRGALLAGGTLLCAQVAFAHADTRSSRFVLVILRGALDGLASVPPLGDRDYAELRRELALHPAGEAGGALPLDVLDARTNDWIAALKAGQTGKNAP